MQLCVVLVPAVILRQAEIRDGGKAGCSETNPGRHCEETTHIYPCSVWRWADLYNNKCFFCDVMITNIHSHMREGKMSCVCGPTVPGRVIGRCVAFISADCWVWGCRKYVKAELSSDIAHSPGRFLVSSYQVLRPLPGTEAWPLSPLLSMWNVSHSFVLDVFI